MAIIILPWYITKISGKVADVVFYYRRGTQCLRIWVMPENPKTPGQTFVRNSFAEAVKSWQAMSEDLKYTYARKARHLNMSGYNLYISQYMRAGMKSIAIASSAGTAISLNRFSSVSKPYTRASGAFVYSGPLKLCPG